MFIVFSDRVVWDRFVLGDATGRDPRRPTKNPDNKLFSKRPIKTDPGKQTPEAAAQNSTESPVRVSRRVLKMERPELFFGGFLFALVWYPAVRRVCHGHLCRGNFCGCRHCNALPSGTASLAQ